MELCLTLYWSELKNVTLSLEMMFHCLHPSPTSLTFVSDHFCKHMHERSLWGWFKKEGTEDCLHGELLRLLVWFSRTTL